MVQDPVDLAAGGLGAGFGGVGCGACAKTKLTETRKYTKPSNEKSRDLAT
jgi:hypothetical protein